MNPIGAAPSAAATSGAAPRDELARLRDTAKQLEGVFVAQLFKAMRETVPEDGLTHGGAGEEMFTGLLDERISAKAPAQWHRGIGDALVRQLAPHLGSQAPTASNPGASHSGASTSDPSRTS
jgi:flagellar protein FlgJ